MTSRAILIGAAAGTIAALAFTIIHGVMINSIWFMLVPMLAAGALCGMLIGWSYVLLRVTYTAVDWLRYNALYLILLFLLGPISLLAFEPLELFLRLTSRFPSVRSAHLKYRCELNYLTPRFFETAMRAL